VPACWTADAGEINRCGGAAGLLGRQIEEEREMTKIQLLSFTFTLVVISNVLAGCGAGSSAAIPDSIGPQALDQLGGGTYRTIYKFKGHGSRPNGQLIAIGGVLYGTTAFGGHRARGAIFTITTSGEKHVLYEFKGRSNGIEPLGGLVSVGGVLYGTTVAGGIHCPGESEFTGCGTVFAVTLSGQERVIYRFKGGSDGVAPFGGLTWLDGKLYGTTSRGGFTPECPQIEYGQGCGTVFSLDTSGHERSSIVFTATVTAQVPTPRCSQWTENSTERRIPEAKAAVAAIITAVPCLRLQRRATKKCSTDLRAAAMEATQVRGCSISMALSTARPGTLGQAGDAAEPSLKQRRPGPSRQSIISRVRPTQARRTECSLQTMACGTERHQEAKAAGIRIPARSLREHRRR
jgi:uncharacterized repeat protein (TIGR03803 family)